MNVISVFEKTKCNPILVLGRFDGLHRGHKTLIEVAKSVSTETGKPVYVFTFSSDTSPKLLTDEEFVFFAKSLGVDGIIYAPLSEQFFSIKKDDFLHLLTENFSPSAVIVGADYTFGFNKQGTAPLLKDYFQNSGVKCFVVPLLTENGIKISSSDIRKFIFDGKIKTANLLLGYNYFFSGLVVKGRGDGKLFGFPTANVFPDSLKIMPKSGVYSTEILIDKKTYKSLTNVGTAPTFNSSLFTTETFVLEFQGDIYNKKVTVFFKDFIRDIKKFDSTTELYEQIKKDLEKL